MGIFGMKDPAGYSLHLLMPNGTEPVINSQQDLNDLFNSWTITPNNISNWRMERIDQDAWIKAATEIFSLGLQNSDGGPSIYATGETYISGLEGQYAEMEGKSILTEIFTIISWPYLLTKNSLVLFHDDIRGIEGTGSTSAEFVYANAIWIKNKKRQETGPVKIYLACKFGKDGQANRRSVTFWNSLAANLKNRFA